MGQALYRKYRPKSLEEVIGQEHVTQTLSQALKQGRISHAYLFTGPKGVGKTSVARILAHEINGLAYVDDSSHLDIVEIDAASNRRIDEIRELRDKVHVAPSSAKYRVYIIDEVHMLTKEAFNALLKTLEEPPEHAVFILATTELHKVPETIASRTQRFGFRPVETTKIVEQLKRITKQEKLKVSDDALSLLAIHGEGSLRDSISLLDQVSNQATSIELADAQRILGLPSEESIKQLLSMVISDSEASAIVSLLSQLYGQGYSAAILAKQLSQALRQDVINKAVYDTTTALDLLAQLIEIPASHEPERFLEVVLLRNRPERAPNKSEAAEETTSGSPKVKFVESPKPRTNPKANFDETIWPRLLQALKQKHNTLYGVVRMAQPSFTSDTLNLAFAFPFHQKRINEASSRQLIGGIIEELTGQQVTIICSVDADASPPTISLPVAETPLDDSLTTINNIFGGTELLES